MVKLTAKESYYWKKQKKISRMAISMGMKYSFDNNLSLEHLNSKVLSYFGYVDKTVMQKILIALNVLSNKPKQKIEIYFTSHCKKIFNQTNIKEEFFLYFSELYKRKSYKKIISKPLLKEHLNYLLFAKQYLEMKK